MKLHSENLRPVAGVLAIHNLNTFPQTSPNKASFKRCMKRSLVLAKEAVELNDAGMESRPTLAVLSIPGIAVDSDGTHTLLSGILLWGQYFFDVGAKWSFGEDGNLVILTSDLIHPAQVIPAEIKHLHYDTYNATNLNEISQEVLEELDLQFDIPACEAAIEVGAIAGVKYKSVYMPLILATEEGVRTFATPLMNAPKEEEFDRSYFNEVCEDMYDHFLIELVDKDQPFGYVSVEVFPGLDADGNPDECPNDTYASIFQQKYADAVNALPDIDYLPKLLEALVE